MRHSGKFWLFSVWSDEEEERVGEIIFCVKWEEEKVLWLIQNLFFKLFCITPPSMCRMSAKSTFLMIDINYMYKYSHTIGDIIDCEFKSASKWAKRWFKCFWNWDFKRNILDVTLMYHYQCINLCLEKCKLGKIPICCQ